MFIGYFYVILVSEVLFNYLFMGNEEKIEEIDTSNIFEDFGENLEAGDDVDKAEAAAKKDLIFYIKIIWNLFKYLNIFLIIALLIAWGYIWLQLNDQFNDKPYLNPICSIMLGTDLNYEEDNCSSLASVEGIYAERLKKENEKKLEKILPILSDLYVIEDFINSKKVNFLFEKTETRNNPLKIIEKFDIIKNDFTQMDKAQIRCSNIRIEENILEVDCEAYSSLWEKGIPWFNWEHSKKDTLVWTSISIASSFINYVDISSMFKIIESQKSFSLQPVVWEGGFIYKTSFSLRLMYDEGNLLY